MLSKRDDFVKALRKEIKDRSKELEEIGETVNTIYFGGGTPSVLRPPQLGSILRSIRKYYPVCDSQTNRSTQIDCVSEPEVTIEVNPDDITPTFMRSIREVGFNRISIGMQSFYDSHLKWMNRRHTGDEAVKSFYIARKAGFNNISIDLIFGFEGLTTHMWRENIMAAISLSPEHISCYQMSVEKGTKLYEQYLSGEYLALNDLSSLRHYTMLQSYLAEAGYIQYEVSSFCKPSMESRHNSSYWNFTPYLGFGPSAHSFYRDKRVWNCRGINSYINGIQKGARLYKAEVLSSKDHFNEHIMLSLRTTEGIDRESLKASDNPTTGWGHLITPEFNSTLNSLLKNGALIEEGGKIKIPPEKLFLSDGIIRDLFV